MADQTDTILKAIPYDLPVSERPYQAIAQGAGVAEDEVLRALADFRARGLIRRIAAVLYHRRAAYAFNAMVVWKVDDGDEERAGKLMASYPEVSHCYEREKSGYWDYNLFTMIHGKTMAGCMDVVQRISKRTGIGTFEVFLSKREFKKTSLMIGNE